MCIRDRRAIETYCVASGYVLNVEVRNGAYPIFIGAGILNQVDLSKFISGSKVLIVTDDVVGPIYLDKIKTHQLHVSCSQVLKQKQSTNFQAFPLPYLGSSTGSLSGPNSASYNGNKSLST